MRTAPQQAARYAPDGEALRRALDMTPGQVAAIEQGEQPGKHGGRVKMRGKRRHQPRHAAADDAETVALEFQAMAGPAPEPAPPARRTGPQPAAVRPTGPQPRFTPNRATGPQRIPRHASSETERILDIARRRADAVPVPAPPVTRPVTAAQAADHIARLQLPGSDLADGYGNIPAHIEYMRRVDHLTGTTTRYVFPGAWPLPVAPQVRTRGIDQRGMPVRIAVTAGTPAGKPLAGCQSRNAGTGEKCGNATPPPHGDRNHFGPSGDEWTDESGTYCAGDVDCPCWDHRRAAGTGTAA